MNLRKITLKYMGWCPGFKAAARFIPDREIPKKRMKQVTYIGGLIFLLYLIYYVVTPPRSYAWDLDFKNAKYDEIYKMYVKEVDGFFDGIYKVKMWVEAPEDTFVLVHFFSLYSQNYLRGAWIYRDGVFYSASQPRTCYGNQYEDEWGLDYHYVWRVYSDSRGTTLHIDVDFLRSEPQILGLRPGETVQINFLLITLIVLLFLGPALAIIDITSTNLDRRSKKFNEVGQ